jgi:thiamine-phosphate pyrophosphorylase
LTLLDRTSIPRLYPILVPSRVGKGTLREILDFATELAQGGATLIQLREKHASSREILRLARELRRVLPESVRLILNDRADLCVASGVNGVHVGQDDLPPTAARRIVGSERIVGLSTHNPEQVKAGDESAADYVAVGPVFSTISKENPDPVIGLEGVKRARALTEKPLVAIGGITLENCRAVIDAGADSVAVITDLVPDPRKRTSAFLLKLR